MRAAHRMFTMLAGVFVSIALLAAAAGSATAADGIPFEIKRLAVCEDVRDREPVGVSEVFSSDIPKVYAFLEAVDIIADTEIDFVWFHGGNEMLRVTVPLKQGGRWRTYANKNLYGLSGVWRVEVQDTDGTTAGAVEFTVQ